MKPETNLKKFGVKKPAGKHGYLLLESMLWLIFGSAIIVLTVSSMMGIFNTFKMSRQLAVEQHQILALNKSISADIARGPGTPEEDVFIDDHIIYINGAEYSSQNQAITRIYNGGQLRFGPGQLCGEIIIEREEEYLEIIAEKNHTEMKRVYHFDLNR